MAHNSFLIIFFLILIFLIVWLLFFWVCSYVYRSFCELHKIFNLLMASFSFSKKIILDLHDVKTATAWAENVCLARQSLFAKCCKHDNKRYLGWNLYFASQIVMHNASNCCNLKRKKCFWKTKVFATFGLFGLIPRHIEEIEEHFVSIIFQYYDPIINLYVASSYSFFFFHKKYVCWSYTLDLMAFKVSL